MNRISINEPCHENWAAMTPTQQGAFCGKCQVDVIDFSGKSAKQVKLILEENVGKHLCGRFKKTQLDDLNASYVEWDDQSPKVFQSKFLYACLIVFGMSLFSCNTPEEILVGEIAIETHDDNSTNHNKEDSGSAMLGQLEITNVSRNGQAPVRYADEDYENLKGKVDYGYYDDHQKKDTLENEEDFIRGDIAYIPDPDYRMDDTIITVPMIEAIDSALGNQQESQPLNTIELTNETGSLSGEFTAVIYPNPAGNLANLSIDVKTSGQYIIELYNLEGQKAAVIFNGYLTVGRSNYQIDLTVYETGTYLVKVFTANQSQTYKVVRTE